MRGGFALSLVCCVAVAFAAISGGFISSNPTTQQLVDDAGRERFFHGVNVVYKGPPYVPQTTSFDTFLSYSEKDAETLAFLGLNVIRLGVMWPGVEPVRGQYNETYLAVIDKIVSLSAAQGIYSLFDMHQDVLSEKFCGEGAPAWAAQPDGMMNFPEPIAKPFPINPETGFPYPADCAKFDWPKYFEAEAVNAAYQAIYSNKNGLATSFANFWLKVAMEFGKEEAVLGYELINEPWAGNVFLDPSLIVPTVADRKNLQPLYDNTAKTIREVDTQHPILFAGVTWDDAGVGFEHVPGGDAWRNKSILAYHFYIPPQIDLPHTMQVRAADMKRLGCGGLMTEFNCGSQPEMDAADAFLQSWIGWEYKSYVPMTGYADCVWNANGTLNAVNARLLARTYARAVAGHTMHMQFNATTSVFSLQYRMDPAIKLPTEIFYSADLHYPKGISVQLLPAGVAQASQAGTNVLEIRPTPEATAATVLSVVISPK